ncbi:GTP 3',8-cyclase MoaA [Lewinella sp. LCG006]|uniref:GTP 3',8-cyclase MoaA n=1 Tax=Lewinella sp. LCG006 TaxID=3231911 RepID=UPI00345FE4C4
MTGQLFDNHGRQINYLRLAVTDRCNLRCFYCMPEEGINYVARTQLLTYEEMLRMVQVLVPLGIEKIRLTGGEPFLRRDFMDFLRAISTIEGLKQINLTTNGTLTEQHVPELKQLGIHSVNLSIDSLDRQRFHEITRRDSLPEVWATFEALVAHGIDTKLNAVVMDQRNIEDILPMVELTKKYPVSVRFIEEMPFNGDTAHYQKLPWDHRRITEHIRAAYPGLEKLVDPPGSTSYNYSIPGHQGTVGIIAAYSRTFCGSCNRIRVTPKGLLKTCLYDQGVLSIRDIMRAGATDDQLADAFTTALQHRAKDGWEAEGRLSNDPNARESMATIGG